MSSKFKYSQKFYETDPAYFKTLNEKENSEAWFQDFYAGVLRHSRPESVILDAGCGTGVSTAWLHQQRPQIRGIDFSGTYIERARQRGDYFEVMDLTRLAFPSQTFDMVCSADALEHVPQLLQALGELDRVLKPGGIMVLQTPNLSSNLVSVNYRRTPGNILRKLYFYLGDLFRPQLRTIEQFDLDVLTGDKDAYNLMSPVWLRHHFKTRGYSILELTSYSLFFKSGPLLRAMLTVMARLPILRNLGGRIVLVVRKPAN